MVIVAVRMLAAKRYCISIMTNTYCNKLAKTIAFSLFERKLAASPNELNWLNYQSFRRTAFFCWLSESGFPPDSQFPIIPFIKTSPLEPIRISVTDPT